MGYWADKIFTGTKGMVKAPGSGGSGLNNSQPLQPVALATGLAAVSTWPIAMPTKTITGSHIALWQAGAAKAVTVPGSNSDVGRKVALAAAPGGQLWGCGSTSGRTRSSSPRRTPGSRIRQGSGARHCRSPFASFQGREAVARTRRSTYRGHHHQHSGPPRAKAGEEPPERPERLMRPQVDGSLLREHRAKLAGGDRTWDQEHDKPDDSRAARARGRSTKTSKPSATAESPVTATRPGRCARVSCPDGNDAGELRLGRIPRPMRRGWFRLDGREFVKEAHSATVGRPLPHRNRITPRWLLRPLSGMLVPGADHREGRAMVLGLGVIVAEVIVVAIVVSRLRD